MDEKKLTIYFTSDLHGYIYPTDYRGQGEKELGLFKCASLFRKDGNTLVIDGANSAFNTEYICYSYANGTLTEIEPVESAYQQLDYTPFSQYGA